MSHDVTIDVAGPADAARVREVYAPYCTDTSITFEYEPPSIEQTAERIARIGRQYPWLVARCDGTVAGYAYATAHAERAAYRWAVDVAVYLDPAFQRRGIGRRLYRVLLRLLSHLGYHRAVALIAMPNAASVGMHEAMGFSHAGTTRSVGHKLGGWHDVGIWELALREATGQPAEPVVFEDVRGSRDVARILADDGV